MSADPEVASVGDGPPGDGDLEVAPDYVPDELPNEFESVATVVVGAETTSAQARSRLVSALREEFDVTVERADEHRRVFLVTHEQESGSDGGDA